MSRAKKANEVLQQVNCKLVGSKYNFFCVRRMKKSIYLANTVSVSQTANENFLHITKVFQIIRYNHALVLKLSLVHEIFPDSSLLLRSIIVQCIISHSVRSSSAICFLILWGKEVDSPIKNIMNMELRFWLRIRIIMLPSF